MSRVDLQKNQPSRDEIFRWIGQQVSWGFDSAPSETQRELFQQADGSNLAIIASFLRADGPSCIFIHCDQTKIMSRRTSVTSLEVPKISRLHVSIHPLVTRESNKAMYLLKVRRSGDIQYATIRSDVVVGMIGGNLLQSFETDVEHFFMSNVEKSNALSVSDKLEIQSALSTFKRVLAGSATQYDTSVASKLNEEAVSSLLNKLNHETAPTAQAALFKALQPFSKSPARKPNNPSFAIDVMTHVGDDVNEHKLVQLLESWAEMLHTIASTHSQRSLASEDGPLVIADFWKSRLASVQAALDGIHSPSIQRILSQLKELSSTRHGFIATLTKLKTVFDQLEEACTKARDIVKFLSVLERCCETMYQGTPKDVIDELGGVLQTLSTARYLTQHFGHNSSLTQLFVSISNQLILNCRNYSSTCGNLG